MRTVVVDRLFLAGTGHSDSAKTFMWVAATVSAVSSSPSSSSWMGVMVEKTARRHRPHSSDWLTCCWLQGLQRSPHGNGCCGGHTTETLSPRWVEMISSSHPDSSRKPCALCLPSDGPWRWRLGQVWERSASVKIKLIKWLRLKDTSCFLEIFCYLYTWTWM